MKTIPTPRCILEPQVASHAHEMFVVLSDPAIYEFENSAPESEDWLLKRFQRLESRGPSDGSQKWLNWVVRLPNGELAGYVQATVQTDNTCFVAYELGSAHWRQGIGSSAVQAMLGHLQEGYRVETCIAVLKAKNFRSESMLRKLGFRLASPAQSARYRDEADELVMVKQTSASENAANRVAGSL